LSWECGWERSGQSNLQLITVGALGYEEKANFQDIQLSQQAFVEVANGGDIRAGYITLTGGSLIGIRTWGWNQRNFAVTALESVKLIGTSADGRFHSGLFTGLRVPILET